MRRGCSAGSYTDGKPKFADVKLAELPVDSWGVATTHNLVQRYAHTAKYGPLMIDMMDAIVGTLKKYKEHNSKSEMQFFLNDGSLCGAIRNGKMIPHDYDVDLGMWVPDSSEFFSVFEFLKDTIEVVEGDEPDADSLKRFKLELFSPELGNHSSKIIIHDPRFGKHLHNFGGVDDWYCVPCDIQLFLDHPSDSERVQIQYFRKSLPLCDLLRYQKKDIFPLAPLDFERLTIPAPCNPETFLTEQYGYLGADCVFDTESLKYKKRPAEHSAYIESCLSGAGKD